MSSVQWFDNDSIAEAQATAKDLRRPLLIDFWSPTCMGCAKLVARTYTDPSVRELLASTFVCVKYNTKKPNADFLRLNGSFAHVWHPDVVVADARLKEARRIIGFLPPLELIAQLRVGVALLELYHANFGAALSQLAKVIDDDDTGPRPEALYWAGVAAYRQGGGLAALRPRWEELMARYPRSDWALRADCLDVEISPAGFDATDTASVRLATTTS
jgi:hypothetical protein